MERGLELVKKYYPVVSNYSYPRQSEAVPRHDRLSVGSDCSVPGMVDDQESDISVDDDYQYHVIGDGIWDSFWNVNSGAANHNSRVDTIENDRYPALVTSPVVHRRRDVFISDKADAKYRPLNKQTREAEPHDGSASSWPLAPTPLLATRSKPQKAASYTLFPQPTPTPRLPLTLTPRQPDFVPRKSSLSEASKHNHSALSLSSLGRSSKPKKLHLPASDGAVSYTSYVKSAPVTPIMPTFPSKTLGNMSGDVDKQTSRPERPQVFVPRTSLEMAVGRPPQQPLRTFNPSNTTTNNPSSIAPPRSPERGRRLLILQRSHTHAPPSIQTRPPTPIEPEVEVPSMSVFEHDSDEDEEFSASHFSNHHHSSSNFARRIVRNLVTGSHKRARSASAALKTRKGSDVAEKQLRRTRVGTATATAVGGGDCDALARDVAEMVITPLPPPLPQPRTPEIGVETDEARLPILKKQKSEVFGKIWGRKW